MDQRAVEIAQVAAIALSSGMRVDDLARGPAHSRHTQGTWRMRQSPLAPTRPGRGLASDRDEAFISAVVRQYQGAIPRCDGCGQPWPWSVLLLTGYPLSDERGGAFHRRP